jgi:hypothetical protein
MDLILWIIACIVFGVVIYQLVIWLNAESAPSDNFSEREEFFKMLQDTWDEWSIVREEYYMSTSIFAIEHKYTKHYFGLTEDGLKFQTARGQPSVLVYNYGDEYYTTRCARCRTDIERIKFILLMGKNDSVITHFSNHRNEKLHDEAFLETLNEDELRKVILKMERVKL